MSRAPFENYGQYPRVKRNESLASRNKAGVSFLKATENHCTSVNFPLVSPPALEGRMAARLLEYVRNVLYVSVNVRIEEKERER